MKKIFSTGLSLLAVCYAFNVSADDNFEYVPYIGVDYGYVDANAKRINPKYHLVNFNIGTKYNKYFGTEVFFEQSASDAKKIDSQNKLKSSYRAYGIDVSAYLPIGCYNTFDLFATLGVGEYVFNHKLNNYKHSNDNAFGYRAGVGLMYNINEKISLRAMARYIYINDFTDVNHLYEYSLGFRYHFY